MSVLANARARKEIFPLQLKAGEEFVGQIAVKGQVYSSTYDSWAPVIGLAVGTFECSIPQATLRKQLKARDVEDIEDVVMGFYGWQTASRKIGIVPVNNWIHVRCDGLKRSDANHEYFSYTIAQSEDGETFTRVQGDWTPDLGVGQQTVIPGLEDPTEEEPF